MNSRWLLSGLGGAFCIVLLTVSLRQDTQAAGPELRFKAYALVVARDEGPSAPAPTCATGTSASTRPTYGFPCPDSVTVVKSGPGSDARAVPNSDEWTVTISYHWVGEAAPTGQRVMVSFAPSWPPGCLQGIMEGNIVTLAAAARGTITTHNTLGRLNDSCAAGSYTANTYSLTLEATPIVHETDIGKYVTRHWGVTGNQPITMTVR